MLPFVRLDQICCYVQTLETVSKNLPHLHSTHFKLLIIAHGPTHADFETEQTCKHNLHLRTKPKLKTILLPSSKLTLKFSQLTKPAVEMVFHHGAR